MPEPTEAVDSSATRPDEPSPQELAPQPEQSSDIFTGNDFNDPVWGKKAKNMQRMHEKGVGDRKKAEQERDDLVQKFDGIKQFWGRHPKLAQQASAVLKREAAGVEGDDDAVDDSTEPSEIERLTQTVGQLSSKIDSMGQATNQNEAMRAVYLEIGKGDEELGRRLYVSEKWDEETGRVAEVWNKGQSDRDAAKQTLELVRLRRQAKQPQAPEARETSGTARVDSERGSGAPMPVAKHGTSRDEGIKEAMENLGVSGAAEWAAVTSDGGEEEG